MSKFPSTMLLTPALLAGAALALGACSSMTTYGTGTTAAAQTVEDITGILSLGGKSKDSEPIDYSARPPIVEPPAATLPPPGSDTSVALAGNWPVDPDEEKKRIDALVEERASSGQSLKFSVPESAKVTYDRSTPRGDEGPGSPASKTFQNKVRASKNPQEEQKKIFADAKMAKTGSFDENGAPIRRYLTEPPALYREPDVDSPVDITEKPKKKKKKFNFPDLWPF